MRTPILLSWSGGKDSAWTLHRLRQEPAWDVVGLLTAVTADYARVAIHGIRREVLQAQAAAAGLPVIEAELPASCDNRTYEIRFAAALDTARRRWPALAHIAFGDLFLAEVRAYRDALCARLGWTPIYPLWGEPTRALADVMLGAGLRAVLCCVDTQQLDAGWLGHEFDVALLASLPAGVDPCGEHGEFHTCVTAGPIFHAPLRLVHGESVLREERFAYRDLHLA